MVPTLRRYEDPVHSVAWWVAVTPEGHLGLGMGSSWDKPHCGTIPIGSDGLSKAGITKQPCFGL